MIQRPQMIFGALFIIISFRHVFALPFYYCMSSYGGDPEVEDMFQISELFGLFVVLQEQIEETYLSVQALFS